MQAELDKLPVRDKNLPYTPLPLQSWERLSPEDDRRPEIDRIGHPDNPIKDLSPPFIELKKHIVKTPDKKESW